MGRKPNPYTRPYDLSPEARAQRKQAAIDRWNARQSKEERLAALAAAHASPNIGWPAGKRRKKLRHAVRDAATGRFIPAAQ